MTTSYQSTNQLNTSGATAFLNNGANPTNGQAVDYVLGKFAIQSNCILASITVLLKDSDVVGGSNPCYIRMYLADDFNTAVTAITNFTLTSGQTQQITINPNIQIYASTPYYQIIVGYFSGGTGGGYYSYNGGTNSGISNGVIWNVSDGFGPNTSNTEVSISFNAPPNTPTFSNISSNGSTINYKPKIFLTVGSSFAGSTIRNVEIQFSTVSSFSSTVLDVQYLNDSGYGTQSAGWLGLPTASNANTNISFTPQSALPVGTLYMRARCKDSNNVWGNWSATQQFTVASVPWSDTLASGNSGYKAIWLNDLATVINNSRQFRGLATFAFTDGTLVAQDANGNNGNDIKALYITERRQKLIDVLNIVGITWNPVVVDNTTDRDQQFIIDLRNYALQS